MKGHLREQHDILSNKSIRKYNQTNCQTETLICLQILVPLSSLQTKTKNITQHGICRNRTCSNHEVTSFQALKMSPTAETVFLNILSTVYFLEFNKFTELDIALFTFVLGI